MSNDIIKYDSSESKFVNSKLELANLTDVNTTGVGNKSLLQYDINNNEFKIVNNISITQLSEVLNIIDNSPNHFLKINSTASNIEYHTISLNDLTDLNLDNVNEKQLLRYNGTKWVNSRIDSKEVTDMPNIYVGKKRHLLM